MAFGFIKKVFSFGKKEVEEVPVGGAPGFIEGAEPKPTEIPAPSPAPTPEIPHPDPAKPAEEPKPVPPEVPEEKPAEIPPEPEPGIPAPEPSPATPEVPSEPPPAEIMPPVRQPAPVEADPLRAEIAPEPGAAALEKAPPQAGAEANLAPLPPLDGEGGSADRSPSSELSSRNTGGAGWGGEADHESPAPFPSAEILPPIRQQAPAETHPVLDEIAPEPETAPAPAKVTVAKSVERQAAPSAPAAPEPAQRTGWFQRLKTGLSRSSRELTDNISGVFSKGRLTEEIIEDLEEVLLRADLGMETALRITDALSSGRYGRSTTEADVRAVMAQEVEKALGPVALPLELDLSHKPHVILVVGVNGTGKTTTIGKLAAKLTAGGLSVMLAAGDTFRAAAIEQLKIWGERTNSPVIASKLGADAAGLAYDAYEKARVAGSDVLIIDTAGRLQNKAELMSELEKIVRVLGKQGAEAPHTVLQTVDATTGQNALNQVEIFRNVAGVNGLVITKLDGTARGGILVAIAAKHKLPVYFIGVGEQVDDLEPFSASDFAKAIAGVA